MFDISGLREGLDTLSSLLTDIRRELREMKIQEKEYWEAWKTAKQKEEQEKRRTHRSLISEPKELMPIYEDNTAQHLDDLQIYNCRTLLTGKPIVIPQNEKPFVLIFEIRSNDIPQLYDKFIYDTKEKTPTRQYNLSLREVNILQITVIAPKPINPLPKVGFEVEVAI